MFTGPAREASAASRTKNLGLVRVRDATNGHAKVIVEPRGTIPGGETSMRRRTSSGVAGSDPQSDERPQRVTGEINGGTAVAAAHQFGDPGG